MRPDIRDEYEMAPARQPRYPRDERVMLIAWAAIAIFAAGIRFLLIDRAPLSEPEAAYAVQVWDAIRGMLDGSLASTGAPLLAHVMALLFFVFGASDTATRLTPALAGVALAISPALLVGTIGRRAALCAGVLLATSPVAVQLSRMADAAMITAALTMLVVASLIRVATDRPWWSPWTLAIGVGLSLADEPGIVIGLVTAALAAAATWGWSPRRWAEDLSEKASRGELRALRGPVAVAVGTALVASTGAAMDLTGAGFGFGELWGGAARILLPAPFPTRNLAADLAYGWPILAAAVFGFVRRYRAGDRLALFLGQWTLLLLALSAVVGQSALVLAILPLIPAALLAAMGLADIAPDPFSFPANGSVYGGALLLLVIAGALTIGVGQSFGAGKGLPPVPAFLGLALLLVALGFIWRASIGPDDVGPTLAVFAAIAFVAVTAGSIARFSYGGSPIATEPLPREATDPIIRETFHDLIILASADPTRALVVDAQTPAIVRWYGRSMPTISAERSATGRAFVIREAPAEGSTVSGTPLRTSLKVTSILNRAELTPLGVGRWLVARLNLLQGKPSDIIISR